MQIIKETKIANNMILLSFMVAILVGCCTAIFPNLTTLFFGISIFSILILLVPETAIALLLTSSYPYYWLLENIYGFNPEKSRNITAIYLVSLTILYFFSFSIIKRDFKFKIGFRNRIDVPTTSFYLLTSIIFINWLIFTFNLPTAKQRIVYFVLLCLFPFITMTKVKLNNIEKIMRIFNILLLLFLFLSFVYYIINKRNFVRFTPIEGYFNAISVALLCAFLIIISTIKALFRKGKRLLYFVYLIPISLLSSIIMFATGSRGPMIALVLAMIMIFSIYILKTLKNKEFNIIILMVIVMLFLIFIFLYPLFSFRNVTGVYERYRNFISNPIKEGESRLDRYKFAVKEMQENVKVLTFGIGLGNFEIMYSGKEAITGPHNYILDAAVELGIIGAIAAIIFIFSVLIKGLNIVMTIEDNNLLIQIMQIIGIFLVSFYFSMISGTIVTHASLYISAGGIIGLKSYIRDKHER